MTATARPPIDGGSALVTGASSGIGRELTLQLATRVRSIVLVGRRADRLEQLRTELLARRPDLKAVSLPADLCDEAAIDRIFAVVQREVGPLDVLVNNAGLGDAALFDRSAWERTRRVLQTNVVALAQLTAAFVPGMVARGRGGVLNIGSGAGLTVMPGAAAYTGSKHFVDGFSEALRADLFGTGVVVTQVCPGPVDSEFDAVAGSTGGMTGAPPPFMRITAAQCAREALAGFERGEALVFPGRPYRFLMTRILPLIPRGMVRRQAARSAARLRRKTR